MSILRLAVTFLGSLFKSQRQLVLENLARPPCPTNGQMSYACVTGKKRLNQDTHIRFRPSGYELAGK